MSSEIKADKWSPASGTSATIGDSGDTYTVPTGANFTVTDELKTNKISPASGTSFTLGDSGDTFTVPSGVTFANSGTATGFASAVTPDNLQYFSTSANQTISANTATVLTNYGDGQITGRLLYNYGTQYVTHSSGIFSFSTEGYYHITSRISGSTTGASSGNGYLNSTTNNSSYADAIDVNFSNSASGGFNYYIDGIFKITDTTNHKVQNQIYLPTNGGEVGGHGGNNTRQRTFMRFARLGTTA